MSSAGSRAASAPDGQAPAGRRPPNRRRALLVVLLLGVAALAAAALLVTFSGTGTTGRDSTAGRAVKTDPGDAAASDAREIRTAGTLEAETRSWPVGQSEIVETKEETVVGRDLPVQRVVPGHGFWVGSGPVQRSFVQQPGTNGTARPRRGEKVTITGRVQPVGEDPRRELGLDPGESALVLDQGAYVRAETVTVR